MTLEEFNDSTKDALTIGEDGIYFTYDDKNYCPFCGGSVEYKDFKYVCSNNCPGSIFIIAHYSAALKKIHEAERYYHNVVQRALDFTRRELAKKYETEIYPRLIEEETNSLEEIKNSVKDIKDDSFKNIQSLLI